MKRRTAPPSAYPREATSSPPQTIAAPSASSDSAAHSTAVSGAKAPGSDDGPMTERRVEELIRERLYGQRLSVWRT
jgi:transcription elongation factor